MGKLHRVLTLLSLALALSSFSSCGVSGGPSLGGSAANNSGGGSGGGGGGGGSCNAVGTGVDGPWADMIGDAGMQTVQQDIALDSQENVYSVGYTYGAFAGSPGTNFYQGGVAKYDRTGVRLWARAYDTGSGSSSLQIKRVIVDANDNIYVGGVANGGAILGKDTRFGYHIFFMKLDACGNPLVAGVAGGSNISLDLNSMAVDGSGNVYLAGTSNKPIDGEPLVGQFSSITVKFDSAGTRQWTRLAQGVAGSRISAYGVVVDGSGNVYISGSYQQSINGNPGVGSMGFLASYDANGTPGFTSVYGNNGSSNNAVIPTGMALVGNKILIAGAVNYAFPGQTHVGSDSFYLATYDLTGAPVGAITQMGAAGGTIIGSRLSVGPSSEVYAIVNPTAAFDGHAITGLAPVVIKFDSAGVKQSSQVYLPSSGSLFGQAVRVGPSGATFISGNAAGPYGGATPVGTSDFLTFRAN